ncbi:DUF221-domain-containing protein [Venturia nashicola]|nr:DUF221-domain-containing protein [Venturia nashicola]
MADRGTPGSISNLIMKYHAGIPWQQPFPTGVAFVLQEGGSQKVRASSSANTLFATLIPVVVVAVAQLAAFLFLRRTQRHLYAPRTLLDTLDDVERTPPLHKNGWFNWIPAFWRLKDHDLLEKQSLDAYLFLRFLKMINLICFVGLCMTWPVLFPVNINGGGKSKELNRLTIGNVKNPNKYYVHLFISWVFLGFVMFTITRETLYYINLRQAYLLTPWAASRMSSRTVLFTSVPTRQLDEEQMRQTFQAVKRVWIINDFSKIKELVVKRDSTAKSLESALVHVSQNAVKENNKDKSNFAKVRYIASSTDRPTQRTMTVIGEKRDAIELNRDRLIELSRHVENAQEVLNKGNGKAKRAAFIEFETISAAQAAMQMTSTQAPLVMVPRCIATVPKGIIWENVGIPSWQVIVRGLLATCFIITLTLFWSIPTSFIGVLSNVSDIADRFVWLHWISRLPPSVLGAIEGLLPSLLLSTLVSYVPIICRYFARLSGEVTTAEIELKTQTWYFIFQVIQVFFVTSLSSGATAVFQDIANNPRKAPELLAKKLPKASNFYLSYFIIYGLGQSTKNLLNWSGLFFDKLYALFDRTPRDKYERYTSMSGTGWGSWYPKFTNLALIAISYSCIAPLTLGFATVAFSILYLCFRYNLFYVVKTSIDTQGRAYAKALQQLTVGVYTAELALIGLFSISVRRHGASQGPLILMVIFSILTAVFHRIMHKTLDPLTKTLPSNAVNRSELDSYRNDDGEEQDPLLSVSEAHEPPSGVAGLFLKFFEPQKYVSFETNYKHLVRTSLGEPVSAMSEEQEQKAYLPPAQTSKTPKLWIAKDDLGVSKKEIEGLGKDLDITDEGAWVDPTGKVKFDESALRELPIFKANVYY